MTSLQLLSLIQTHIESSTQLLIPTPQNKMKKAELVFIPTPGAGHLVSTVEIAKILVDRDERISITVLIIKLPFDNKVAAYTESLVASNLPSRIKFIILPDDNQSPPPGKVPYSSLESKKTHVKEAVAKLTGSPDSPTLAGFVLDMFCMCMVDVADELRVPSYVFFTSSAASLGSFLNGQALYDQNKLTTELIDSGAELQVPTLLNSIPARLLPSSYFDKEWAEFLFGQARRYRIVKGIMVNTFEELEPYAVKSFYDGKIKIPPVYAVGPVVNITGDNYAFGPGGIEKKAEVMTWLDDQPESSVVFLCFGSRGCFDVDQAREIAHALEQCGHRFLWSLRQAPTEDKNEMPSDYADLKGVLPEGFLDRTAEIGKVIGWAPQVAVLSHPAVGGFVSHCGWNSTLESIRFGVPIATWPMYAEQQANAFQLVIELGLAVEIKMDYRKDILNKIPTMVTAEEIERGIKCLMNPESEIRKRVKEMSAKAGRAVMDGGSSFSSLGRFIDDVLDNM